MKFVVAGSGSRGDVEPCIAVARELLRRGHDVRMAATVPPDMAGVVESAGLTPLPYGRGLAGAAARRGFRPDAKHRIHCPGIRGREHGAAVGANA